MTSTLTLFNAQIGNLLNDLIDIVPNNRDIKLFREKYELLKSANPRKVLELFVMYVYPFKKSIMERDEEFFMSGSIENSFKSNVQFQKEAEMSADMILAKALNLKDIWKTQLSSAQQNTIWEYFQVLIVLMERYIASSVGK